MVDLARADGVGSGTSTYCHRRIGCNLVALLLRAPLSRPIDRTSLLVAQEESEWSKRRSVQPSCLRDSLPFRDLTCYRFGRPVRYLLFGFTLDGDGMVAIPNSIAILLLSFR